MGYQHIENLYKNQDILHFAECYAMEKIHGTSAHVAWNGEELRFFAGGCKHATFVALFDEEFLHSQFERIAKDKKVTVYGEAYGGSIQRMRDAYGDKIRFVAFEVEIDGLWLDVPKAESLARDLGFEFVFYRKVPTTLEALDAERDSDSVQAVRNGMGTGHMREGIVLRPPIEVTKNNGSRIIAKHKRDDFRETASPRKVLSEERFAVLQTAREVADEWVTEMRLDHILDNEEPDLCNMSYYIGRMQEDVEREGKGEIEETLLGSSALRKEIGRATAIMVKKRVNKRLAEGG